MTVTVTDASAAYIGVTLYTPAGTGISAKYAIPSSQTLQIDLTDLVRAYPSGMVMVYEMDAAGGTISTDTKSWTTSGRLNPANSKIPTPWIQHLDGTIFGDWSGLMIAPPSRMINSAYGSILELFRDYTDPLYYRILHGGSYGTLTEIADGVLTSVTLDSGDGLRLYNDTSGNGPSPLDLSQETQNECKDYVTLRWISRYGNTKQATFERRDDKTNAENTIEIEHPLNEFDTRKGILESFTAFLDNLNAYDVWYYSDLITSPQVLVVDGVGSYHQVEVTTKSAKIPNSNAGALNTLEIQINNRKYDTL